MCPPYMENPNDPYPRIVGMVRGRTCLAGEIQMATAFLLLTTLVWTQASAQEPAKQVHHPLHGAVLEGEVQDVKKLLSQGVNPDVPTKAKVPYDPVKTPWATIFHCYLEPGATAVHVAIVKKKPEVLKVLLENKASPSARDKSGYSPLYYVVRVGDSAAVKTLLKYGAKLKDERGLFSEAVSLGWIELARYLLDHGMDINEPGFADFTALHWVISRGDTNTAKWLLGKGADINRKGYSQATPGNFTPLGLAVHADRLEMVPFLLKQGADATIPDNTGFPLDIAMAKKNLKLAGPLIEAADKKFLNQHHFLHKAIQKDFAALVPVLLQKGAEINGNDNKGNTPLHLACEREDAELITLLLKHQANLEGTDNQGRTPLFVAVAKASKVTTMTSGLIGSAPKGGFPVGGLQPFPPLGKLKDQPGFPQQKQFVFPEGKHPPKALAQLKLLLDRGAKVNAVDKKGLTPLHYAALIEDEKAFQKLTGLLAHPHIATMTGNASYWTTTEQFNGYEAAQMLLKCGADPLRKTQTGLTPLDLCINSKTSELLQKSMKGQK